MSYVKEWKKAYQSDLLNISNEIKEILKPPSVLIIEGPLGVGKTTFSKIFIKNENATSPTYSIVNEWDRYLHADLYRIENKMDLIDLEFPLYLEDKDYVLIEWGARFMYELQKIIGQEFQYYILKIENSKTEDCISRNFYLEKIELL